MVELGLLLYQIGTGIATGYAVGAAGLGKAKAEALGNIHALNLRMGLMFAEMVQNFLEFEARPLYLLAPNEEKQETEYVKGVISALMRLEHDFMDTAIAPILLETKSGPEVRVSEVTPEIASPEPAELSLSLPTLGTPSIATTA
jgi:hypothetical protein